MKLAFAVCALALWVGFASVGRAEPKSERVLLLSSAEDDEAARRAVTSGLTRAGVSVTDVTEAGLDAAFTACRTLDCARDAVVRAGVDFALFVRVVEGQDGRPVALTLSLVDADGSSGDARVKLQDAQLERASTEAYRRAKLAAALGQDALVRVESTPPGALVTIDGILAGVAPSEYRVPPGTRSISFKLDGFLTEERRVLTEAGRALDLSVELERSTKGAVSGRSDASEASVLDFLVGGTLVLAAVPALVSSLDSLSRDGECVGAWDAMGRCGERVRFGARSVLLLVGGVLAAGVGTFVLLDRPFSTEVELSPEGARFAIRGRL